VLEAVRTLNVWLLDLALFYYFTDGRLGEAWSPQWSWLQAIGFAVLVSSALTYGRGNVRAAKANAAEDAAVDAPAAAEEGEAEHAPLLAPLSPQLPPLTPAGGMATPGSEGVFGGRSIPRRVAVPRSGSTSSVSSTPRLSAHRITSLASSSVVGSPMVAGRYFADFTSHT